MLLLLLLGIGPPLIWLLLSLREDVHPESNWMVLRIFFYGMLIAIPTGYIEVGLFELTKKLPFSLLTITLINTVLAVALIEELVKYVIARYGVFSNSQFDEPVDAMLYMITGALGFAAMENILFLNDFAGDPFVLSSLRFLGANLFHALASAIVGYYAAISFLRIRARFYTFLKGLVMATILHSIFNFSLHAVYNLSIIELSQGLKIIAIVLLGSLLFVLIKFQELRSIKSICKVKINKL